MVKITVKSGVAEVTQCDDPEMRIDIIDMDSREVDMYFGDNLFQRDTFEEQGIEE